jgi:hypothetical protein
MFSSRFLAGEGGLPAQAERPALDDYVNDVASPYPKWQRTKRRSSSMNWQRVDCPGCPAGFTADHLFRQPPSVVRSNPTSSHTTQ